MRKLGARFSVAAFVRRSARQRWMGCGCVLALVTWAATGAQEAPGPATGPAAAAPASRDLLQQIRTQIGDARCDAEADCHTIALGLRACGGPESYASWSSASTASAPLEALVTEHRAARARELRGEHAASTCDFKTDPGATCNVDATGGHGRCRLRLHGAGASAV